MRPFRAGVGGHQLEALVQSHALCMPPEQAGPGPSSAPLQGSLRSRHLFSPPSSFLKYFAFCWTDANCKHRTTAGIIPSPQLLHHLFSKA